MNSCDYVTLLLDQRVVYSFIEYITELGEGPSTVWHFLLIVWSTLI